MWIKFIDTKIFFFMCKNVLISLIFRELLDAMQDSEAGVPLQSFEIDQFMYKHCFTGKMKI